MGVSFVCNYNFYRVYEVEKIVSHFSWDIFNYGTIQSLERERESLRASAFVGTCQTYRH